MGIFSSKRKTYVSSSVWNMAGDVNKRPNFLKTTIFNHVINESQSIAESLTGSYSNGPGIRLRRFSKWSITNFDPDMGNVEGGFLIRKAADPDTVAAQIHAINSSPSTEVTRLQSLNIGLADYTFWAEKHILENKIEIVNDDWKVDFNGITKVMHFTYPDGSTEDVAIPDYDERAEYLYAVYQTSKPTYVASTTWLDGSYIQPDDPFPDTTGYTLETNTTTPRSQLLTNKVTTWATFSDGRPEEGPFVTTTTDTKNWDDFDRTYIKDQYMGNDPTPGSDRTYTNRYRYKFHQDGQLQSGENTTSTTETIAGGVIKTNWTKSEYQQIWLNKFWELTLDKVIDEDPGPLKMFIYKSGSGNTVLDSMFERQQAIQSFLPFIPFRINNKFLSYSNMGDIYIKAKKAFKKATGGEYADVMKELKKNEDIGDIDYIYTVFGVSLNTPSQSGRKYIYTLFHDLIAGGIVPNPGDNQDYTEWLAEREAAESKLVVWTAWKQAQSDPSNPAFGTPEPERPALTGTAPNSLRVYSKTKPVMNYDYSVLWDSLREDIVPGMFASDMKVGEYRITTSAPQFETGGSLWAGVEIPLDTTSLNTTRIVWQETSVQYRVISIIGLDSKNLIYNGKAVEINAKEALEDQEESGFLIPIQMDTYKKMSLLDQTQLSMSNAYLVCNAYKVVTRKWYQRGAFQIVLIIIVIVIAVVTYGGGAAAAGGILGSNAAVGAALGLAAGSAAAVIVGAIANAIAAALVMKVISYAANKFIGGKWGAIIGAIVAIIAISIGTGMANGQTFSASVGQLARADNLLKLTEATSNAYMKYVNQSTMDLINQTNELVQDYKEEARQISDAWANAFGTDRAMIDPTMITEAFGVTMEDVNTFLTRTLMNGQDIAEMSMDMVLDFVNSSLRLDLPT